MRYPDERFANNVLFFTAHQFRKDMRTRSIIAFLIALSILPSIGRSQRGLVPRPPVNGVAPPPPIGGMPPPPPFTFNLSEMKFGAQGIDVQSCMYVQITNTSRTTQVIKKLYVADGKEYSIPSPSQQMLPVSVQPTSSMTISVCFKPTKPGDHNSYLALLTEKDSFALNIQGKGLKKEDLAKMPKAGLLIEHKKKKSKDWLISLRILAQSRVTMQIFDELGMLVQTFSMNDIKPEGVYEQEFHGLDKGHKPLAPGTYYVRCIVDEIARNTPTIYTKAIEIK